MRRSPDTFALLAMAVLLAGCAARTPEPEIVLEQPEIAETQLAEETIEVREVPRPCTARIPNRPDPLPSNLPTHPVALAALLGAKLAEYSAPGKYADQAEAYFRACPPTR
jgi:hypothetical protein